MKHFRGGCYPSDQDAPAAEGLQGLFKALEGRAILGLLDPLKTPEILITTLKAYEALKGFDGALEGLHKGL